MNRTKSLINNTVILGIGMLLPKVCSYLVLPIITLNIASADYGGYDLFITIITFILPITTLQVQSAAYRYLFDARDNKEKAVSLVTNSVLYIALSTTILIALWLIFSPIALRLRIYMGCYYFLDVFFNVLSQITRGLGKNKNYAISSIFRSVIMLLMVYITVKEMALGMDGLYISLCISIFVSICILIIKIDLFHLISFHAVSTIELREMLKYSVPLIPNAISLLILSSSDRIVISTFLGIEANAQYAIASKFPTILSSVISVFTASWTESATMANNKDDTVKFYYDIHNTYLKILSSITLLLMAGTPLIFNILIHGDYTGGFVQIPLIYIGVFLSGINAFYGSIYIAEKMVNNVMKTTLIATAINLVIDLILINLIGLYAATISTIASYLVVVSLRRLALKKRYDIRLNINSVLAVIVLSVFAVLIYYYQNWILYCLYFAVTLVSAIIICRNEIFAILKKIKR